jgi:hypothetical protein
MALASLNSFLNGNPVQQYAIPSPDTHALSVEDVFLPAPVSHSLQMIASLLIAEDVNFASWYGKRVVGLGAGKVCDYCGVYCPPGQFVCHRCDGLVGTGRMITPFEFPFICQGISSMSITPGQPVAIDLTFGVCGDITPEIFQYLEGQHFELAAIPHSLVLHLNYYLCEYCGMAADKGSDCYGCGGGQLPLAEIVNMNRACLYCGNNNAFSGIFCQQCGARLQGEMLRDYLPFHLNNEAQNG